jgi:hypothetical protein
VVKAKWGAGELSGDDKASKKDDEVRTSLLYPLYCANNPSRRLPLCPSKLPSTSLTSQVTLDFEPVLWRRTSPMPTQLSSPSTLRMG